MNGMEVSSLIHQSDSLNSFPLSMNEVEIRLLTKKDDDILKVELVYNEKYKFAKAQNEYIEYKENCSKIAEKRKQIELITAESGGKEEWMYDSYTYLFFENGKLASFIK